MASIEYLQEVRSIIEHRRGRPLNLEEQRYVENWVNDEGEDVFDPYSAALKIEEYLEHKRTSKLAARTEDGQIPDETEFPWVRPLSHLYARYAAKVPAVVSVRQDLLDNQLIDIDQVSAWVEARNRDYVRPVPVSGTSPRKRTTDLLSFALPGNSALASKSPTWLSHSVPVSPDSSLFSLSLVSEQLEMWLPWSTAAATTWILTGTIPLIGPVRSTTRQQSNKHFGSRTWITLEIERDVTPEQLKRIYTELRTAKFGRLRSQKPRTYEITELVASAPPNATWERLFGAWNKRRPQKSVGEIRDFRKYVRRSIGHLFGPDAPKLTIDEDNPMNETINDQ